MNNKARRIALNILGLIIFATIAIFALFLARGNRFDLSTGQLITTGTIRISSQPEDIKVYVDEQLVQLNEKRVENIDPGEHQIRITSEGFDSWEGVIDVEAGFINDLAVKLFPTVQNLTRFTDTNVNKAEFDYSRTNVFYSVTESRTGSELGIWRKPLRESFLPIAAQNTATKLTNFNPEFISADDHKLIPSRNAERLVLTNQDFSEIHLINTNTTTVLSEDTMIEIDYPIQAISFIDNNNLLIENENMLLEYNIPSENTNLLYYQPQITPVYYVTDGIIYWLDSSKQNIMSRTGNTTNEIELENITLPANINQLHVAHDENLFVLSHDESITYIESTTSYSRTFDNYELVTVSPNGKFTLAQSTVDQLIDVIDTEFSQVLDEAVHDLYQTELNKDELDDGNVMWSFGSNYFLFRDNNGNIISTDSRGGNRRVIVTNDDERINGEQYSITDNSEALFISLQDGTAQQTKSNIYKLDFIEVVSE